MEIPIHVQVPTSRVSKIPSGMETPASGRISDAPNRIINIPANFCTGFFWVNTIAPKAPKVRKYKVVDRKFTTAPISVKLVKKLLISAHSAQSKAKNVVEPRCS